LGFLASAGTETIPNQNNTGGVFDASTPRSYFTN